MPCMQVTLNTITVARSVMDLMTNGTGGGYVCVPAGGCKNGMNAGSRATYLSVQNSLTSTASSTLYKGDENIAVGTNQGKELAIGVIDVNQGSTNCIELAEVYLLGSTTGVKANLEVHFE